MFIPDYVQEKFITRDIEVVPEIFRAGVIDPRTLCEYLVLESEKSTILQSLWEFKKKTTNFHV
jgi:hypothetical protein